MRLRRGRQGESGAPQWSLTYADMMSLLLVLFIFLYSLRVEVPAHREPRGIRVADGIGWTFLGRVACRPAGSPGEWQAAADEDEIDLRLRSRLVGGACRVALLGQAPSREQAFRAARAVQAALAARDIGEERFVLLAQRAPPRAGEPEDPFVDVFATAGVAGGD